MSMGQRRDETRPDETIEAEKDEEKRDCVACSVVLLDVVCSGRTRGAVALSALLLLCLWPELPLRHRARASRELSRREVEKVDFCVSGGGEDCGCDTGVVVVGVCVWWW